MTNNRFYDRNGILIVKASSSPLSNKAYINGVVRNLDTLTPGELKAVKYFDNLRLDLKAKEEREKEILHEAIKLIIKYRSILSSD